MLNAAVVNQEVHSRTLTGKQNLETGLLEELAPCGVSCGEFSLKNREETSSERASVSEAFLKSIKQI